MEELESHGKTPIFAWIQHGESMDIQRKMTLLKSFRNPIGTAYLVTFGKSGTGSPYALFYKNKSTQTGTL